MSIELLRKGYRISLDIESKKEVLKELRASLEGLKSIRIDEKVQGGKLHDDTSLIDKIDKITRLEKEIEELYNLQFKINDAIDKVENPNERILLRYRYILSITWEKISEKMGYSVAHVKRIHEKAIINLKMSLNELV